MQNRYRTDELGCYGLPKSCTKAAVRSSHPQQNMFTQAYMDHAGLRRTTNMVAKKKRISPYMKRVADNLIAKKQNIRRLMKKAVKGIQSMSFQERHTMKEWRSNEFLTDAPAQVAARLILLERNVKMIKRKTEMFKRYCGENWVAQEDVPAMNQHIDRLRDFILQPIDVRDAYSPQQIAEATAGLKGLKQYDLKNIYNAGQRIGEDMDQYQFQRTEFRDVFRQCRLWFTKTAEMLASFSEDNMAAIKALPAFETFLTQVAQITAKFDNEYRGLAELFTCEDTDVEENPDDMDILLLDQQVGGAMFAGTKWVHACQVLHPLYQMTMCKLYWDKMHKLQTDMASLTAHVAEYLHEAPMITP